MKINSTFASYMISSYIVLISLNDDISCHYIGSISLHRFKNIPTLVRYNWIVRRIYLHQIKINTTLASCKASPYIGFTSLNAYISLYYVRSIWSNRAQNNPVLIGCHCILRRLNPQRRNTHLTFASYIVLSYIGYHWMLTQLVIMSLWYPGKYKEYWHIGLTQLHYAHYGIIVMQLWVDLGVLYVGCFHVGSISVF